MKTVIEMVIKRTDPPYPRRGPSCLLVLFVAFGIAIGAFVIVNAEEVRQTIIPTPTPEPTRTATEYALLADLSERDREYEKAIEYYEEAIRLDATKPEFYIRLINLYVQTGQPEEALEAAEQATVLAPDNDQVWTAVAAAYLANGDRLSYLGDTTGAQLQYAEAVQAAERAIDLNPENADAYAYSAGGLVLPQQPEKYEQAQERANYALALDPDNPIAYLYMGTTFDYQGYYSAAREQYQRGIQADSSLADLHINLAYNYFGTGDTPRAILSFEEAITVDPDNAVAYDGLAYMYLQLGQDAIAIENAQKAVELDPNMARAYGRLGQAYFRQFNYPRAIEALEKAVSLYEEPTALNARFFNMLAMAYIRDSLDACPQAVPLFEEVLAVSGPGALVVDEAQGGLEECRQAALENAP